MPKFEDVTALWWLTPDNALKNGENIKILSILEKTSKKYNLTCKYDVTTPDPGLKLLLTNFGIERPASTAFLAKSPAVNITLGLLVLEQDVIEDNKMLPSLIELNWPSMSMLKTPPES